jgi:hypothetical protein
MESAFKLVHARGTEGLGALDRDRAGSLADEGGVSAAAVEAQEPDGPGDRDRPWRVGAVAAILIILGGLLYWQRPGR